VGKRRVSSDAIRYPAGSSERRTSRTRTASPPTPESSRRRQREATPSLPPTSATRGSTPWRRRAGQRRLVGRRHCARASSGDRHPGRRLRRRARPTGCEGLRSSILVLPVALGGTRSAASPVSTRSAPATPTRRRSVRFLTPTQVAQRFPTTCHSRSALAEPRRSRRASTAEVIRDSLRHVVLMVVTIHDMTVPRGSP